MCCIVPSSVAPTAGRRRRPVAVSAIQGDETRPGVHPFRSLLVAISMIDFQLEGYLAGSGRGRAAGRQPWWLAGAGTGACVCVSYTTDTAAVRPGGRPQLVCLCPMPISNKHEPPRDVCESRVCGEWRRVEWGDREAVPTTDIKVSTTFFLCPPQTTLY